jgi:ABC-2 type transport system ATP-binding protein
MVATPTISTEGLTKFYGTKVGVEDITFSVEPGEVVGFLGPNGSGKTTVLRMLVGLITVSRGRAELFGRDIRTSRPSFRADIGYLPGTLGLYEKMTAAEYFSFLARMRQRDCATHRRSLCERLNLDPTTRIHSMSKGTRQKVGVVQAFMHSPRLLILDEPTSGLDPLVQHAFDDLLHESSASGVSVLLSSHVMSEVQRLASKVAILNEGELVAFDRVEDLPGHESRTVVLEFDTETDPAFLRGALGFTLTGSDGRFVEGISTGSQRDLLEAALRHGLVRVHSPEPSLDELFRHLVDPRHTSTRRPRESQA